MTDTNPEACPAYRYRKHKPRPIFGGRRRRVRAPKRHTGWTKDVLGGALARTGTARAVVDPMPTSAANSLKETGSCQNRDPEGEEGLAGALLSRDCPPQPDASAAASGYAMAPQAPDSVTSARVPAFLFSLPPRTRQTREGGRYDGDGEK